MYSPYLFENNKIFLLISFFFFLLFRYALLAVFPSLLLKFKFGFENVQIESRLKSSECLVKIVTAHAI